MHLKTYPGALPRLVPGLPSGRRPKGLSTVNGVQADAGGPRGDRGDEEIVKGSWTNSRTATTNRRGLATVSIALVAAGASFWIASSSSYVDERNACVKWTGRSVRARRLLRA